MALSVFGGYTGEEIAGILEKNPSTIRSKYHQGIEKNEREAGGMRMEHKKSNHSWDEEEIKKILRTVSQRKRRSRRS